MELVCLKVKICRKHRADGKGMENDYPDFNQIPVHLRGEMDWCNYIDQFGGWHYDKESGFFAVDPGDPSDPHNNIDPNCQYGCMLVEQAFADAAITKFGDRVSKIDEASFERFYNERAHAHEPVESVDLTIVQGIAAKKQAGAALTKADNDALDPTNPTRGIRKNHHRYFKDWKKKRGVAIA